MPYLIGLDLGTSDLKAALIDGKGRMLADCSAPSRLTVDGDRVEFDAEMHYADVCGLIRQLANQAPEPVAALSMAAAAGNTLLADETGKPLTTVTSWLDNRGRPAERLPLLRGLDKKALWRLTGWPCLDFFPLAHLGRFAAEEPERYRRAAMVMQSHEYLNFRWTGRRVLDHSSATPQRLVDQVRRCYSPELLAHFNLSEKQLPRLVEPGTVIGPLTAAAQRDTGLGPEALVIAGSFDHPGAALGAGVNDGGELLLSCGTSWVGFFPHADREEILNAGLLCDSFRSGENGPWAALFSIPCLGRELDRWVLRFVAPEAAEPFREFDRLAAMVPPGTAIPAIDFAAPEKTLAGLDRAVAARAVMEFAATEVAKKLAELRRAGMTFKRATMVGGASRSPVWPGIVADRTGLAITPASRLAGARGAAMLAGIGIGLFHDRADAIKQCMEA